MTKQMKWSCRYGVVLTGWIGANWLALGALELYESWQLETEYHVPARVIRSYESSEIVLALKGLNGDVSLRYRLRPPRWSAELRSIPLVVFLHGAGERGSDNVRQLRSLSSALCDDCLRSLHPCAVLAPQCPNSGDWSQKLGSESDLLDCVLQMIDAVSNDARIDPNRIYLVGFSMGGFGAWELAARAPGRFAAVVPICGGGDERRVHRLVNVPLWAVHGADDAVIPPAETRTMIAALKRAGGKPHYLEIPGAGHNCWDSVFIPDSQVLSWMFQQVQNPPASVVESR
jgi:predicted peptidase